MTREILFIVVSITVAALLIASGSEAQWNTDPAVNLGICNTTGDQTLPKIGTTSDGGSYICWFDNRSGNYSVYLQKLNGDGEEEWLHNGLLISGHSQESWLTDYDMVVDSNDNAVIVFPDVRNGNDWDIFAYKINSDGDFLWGANGIQLSTTTEFEASPKVAETAAGNFVMVWSAGENQQIIRLQKLSVTGQKMWGDDGLTIQGTGNENLTYPDVVTAESDNAIVIWTNYTGPFWAPITNDIYSQKFDSDGAELWETGGTIIFNLSGLPGYREPELLSDANGGAFYFWHDDRNNNMLFSVFVQRISADGNIMFAANGVEASTLGNRHHLDPSLAYIPQTDELFVFWNEENSGQSQSGIYGQKFSPQGGRLWTNSGRMFLPVGNIIFSSIQSLASDDALYICYFNELELYNHRVSAFRIDREGEMVWDMPSTLSTATSMKGFLVSAIDAQGSALLTWRDERNDSGDIYAQNVNPDGSLGIYDPVGVEDRGDKTESIPGFVILEQNYPNPFNPTTTIRYAMPFSDHMILKIYDVSGKLVRTLIDCHQEAGYHSTEWDGTDDHGQATSSGLYFYQIEAGENYQAVKQMILLK